MKIKVSQPNKNKIKNIIKNLPNDKIILGVGWFEESKYPSGEKVLDVAMWQEYGTKRNSGNGEKDK